MESKTKILIGAGILTVIIVTFIGYCWILANDGVKLSGKTLITGGCSEDSDCYSNSICQKRKCFVVRELIPLSSQPITEEQAIVIAKENEKIKDFLKWFINPEIFVQGTICDEQCMDIVCEGGKNCGVSLNDAVWIVSFHKGEKWDSFPSARVLINAVSGKSVSAQSDYTYWSCGKDEDCVKENCACGCINQVFKKKFERCIDNCLEEYYESTAGCKCINNACTVLKK
ncbi:hypothetical protein BWK69_00950 [Candidatus Parcubacteria bacterium A4]|nr:MAG: hypothetical protein BWK69_00950 [Candidatus Parcubacteria bacterium A4]